MDEAYDPALEAEAGGGGLTAIIIAVVAVLGLAGLGGLYYAGALDRLFGMGPYATPSDPAAGDMRSAQAGSAAPAPAQSAPVAATPAEVPMENPAEPDEPAETAPASEQAAQVSIDGRWCSDGAQVVFADGRMTTSGEGGNSIGRFTLDGQTLTVSNGDTTVSGTARMDGANVLVLGLGGEERRLERC